MKFSSIWPVDRTISGATTPGQSGPGNNSIEGVICILQSSSSSKFTQLDCLLSYPGHLLGGGLISSKLNAIDALVWD